MQKIVLECPWLIKKPQDSFNICKIKEKPYVCVTASFYTKREKCIAAIEYYFAEPQEKVFVIEEFNFMNGEAVAKGCIFGGDNRMIKRFLAEQLFLNPKRKIYMDAIFEHFPSGGTDIGRIQVYNDFDIWDYKKFMGY